MTAKEWAELITWFCLAVAETGADRTVFHSRIDGLILPACEPLPHNCFWPF